jgi:hypothetical protein
MMTIKEPVWSIWNCSKCKPLKTRPYEESVWNDNHHSQGQMMNSISCPYKYIEFRDDGIIKSRIPYGSSADKMSNWNNENITGGLCQQKQKDYSSSSSSRCHDCGVPIGQIHHITCDMETCPRCSDQLLKCECCLVALTGLSPKEINENLKNPTVYDYVISLDKDKRIMIFKDVFLHKKIPKNSKALTHKQIIRYERERLAAHIGK